MRTATDLRDATLAHAVGELGYTSGRYDFSKFGKADSWASPWLYGTAWDGLWCNRFLSWAVDQAMGQEAGEAAVGRQKFTPLPVGFAATWLQREHFRYHDRHVGFHNSQPGDYYLFKLPGRQANATNHVGMFVKWHTPGKIAVTIEANLPRPGHGTTDIGVHYHYRDITYVIGVYRPDWQAAADVWNTNHPPQQQEDTMTPEQEQRILDRIDKLRAERTNAHVKEYGLMEKIRAEVGNIPARVWDFPIPFIKGTSAHNTFGAAFRAGALMAYSAIGAARGTTRKEADRVIAELSDTPMDHPHEEN